MPAPLGNQFGKNGGRPAHFETIEQLDAKIQEYWDGCQMKKVKDAMTNEEIIIDGKQPTITGLAHFLGFASRQSFYDYEGEEEFSYTIKRARLQIESNYEQHLFSKNAAGPIFALKNFGWKDNREIKHEISNPFFNDPLADDPAHDGFPENKEA